ncbi:MAG: hypothetical protein EWV48_15325 [Microcystis aeruginosa Ma_QC_C_20070823_S13]|jgi:hypothetical protein|uniref:Uncharacterized protein n=1 Tax=Microcystis aeruginosa G11-04 TaxID=2685956 RepID=A0A966FY42_MICAE|nr:hypothetical protein [Microcystis sp. M046S2]MCA2947758.1 hypothetical protein [Microcystis sp. M109S1]NCQ68793.1 hypothetical protein [Microcystis aeruginosa W13-16]NCQ73330.1 hypothetical protein [Microcystis aeruginosa W13-13]NCQ77819.1 hypothetical protein [Microcystis aeruginosa W13-15]NCR11998.1 hypothetical protein [Microcystis aeruginosa SX13-11]NCS21199.1 hypothetical protein [Microcystis aeruginosa G11-06]NCS56416.1 hypothetical protein [Microcystis aeruginosa G11-04]TRU55221.1
MSRKRGSPRNPFSVRYLRVIGYQLGRWCDIMGSKVAQKADQFAISIVNADKYLSPEKKEFILL